MMTPPRPTLRALGDTPQEPNWIHVQQSRPIVKSGPRGFDFGVFLVALTTCLDPGKPPAKSQPENRFRICATKRVHLEGAHDFHAIPANVDDSLDRDYYWKSVKKSFHLDMSIMENTASEPQSPTHFRFLHYLAGRDTNNTRTETFETTALIVLNCPIDDFEYFQSLHAHAAFVLFADGGANRVHDLISAQSSDKNQAEHNQTALSRWKPDLIHGDLDSIRDDVRQAWEDQGTRVTHDPDQYSTDFGKATGKVKELLPGVSEILVLGSIGGRVDQGIGLLHELLREQKYRHPDIRLWLFTESSVTVLLRPGTSIIHTPLRSGLIEPNVGILPMYGKSTISLKGFEWDVQDWETEMGGQVSTSNHVFADELEITTSREVLFTIERKKQRR